MEPSHSIYLQDCKRTKRRLRSLIRVTLLVAMVQKGLQANSEDFGQSTQADLSSLGAHTVL